MAMTKDAVISEAMNLSDDDRLEIVWQLPQSLDAADGVASEWKAEIDRRIKSISDGTAKFIAWDEVRSKLIGATDAASS